MTPRVVDFPDEWGTAPPIDALGGPLDCNKNVALGALLLADGSNLFALVYPGGARFARTAWMIDWGIEERYTGEPPAPADAVDVDEQWRAILKQMRDSGAAVDEQYEAAGLPPDRSKRRGDGP
jgi:hypothetical protein